MARPSPLRFLSVSARRVRPGPAPPGCQERTAHGSPGFARGQVPTGPGTAFTPSYLIPYHPGASAGARGDSRKEATMRKGRARIGTGKRLALAGLGLVGA